MTELQQLDNADLQLDNRSEDDQLEDEDSTLEDGIPDPDGIDKIPEGKPTAINDGSSNIDKETSESYYSESDQEDATLSKVNKNQLQRKTIPRTDELFLKRVEIVSKIVSISSQKKELELELEKEVIQSTKVRFCKTEYSYIQKKLLKRTKPKI